MFLCLTTQVNATLVKVAQSYPTLFDPVDYSMPGFLSMGFPRQEYWSGLPCPPPGDLPDSRIEPTSPALAGGLFTTSTTWEGPEIPYSKMNKGGK